MRHRKPCFDALSQTAEPCGRRGVMILHISAGPHACGWTRPCQQRGAALLVRPAQVPACGENRARCEYAVRAARAERPREGEAPTPRCSGRESNAVESDADPGTVSSCSVVRPSITGVWVRQDRLAWCMAGRGPQTKDWRTAVAPGHAQDRLPASGELLDVLPLRCARRHPRGVGT